MNKTLLITLIILFAEVELLSPKTITGSFSVLRNQPVRLVGFYGFEMYTIDSVKTSVNGVFTMRFSEKDYGVAYLVTDDNKSFIMLFIFRMLSERLCFDQIQRGIWTRGWIGF
jgi:hypothetical protein